MVRVKSASFVFLLLVLAVAANANSNEESKHDVDSLNDTSTKTESSKQLDDKSIVKATAKERITRKKKKVTAVKSEKDEITATRPNISKITLKNRNKPDLYLPKVRLNEHPKLRDIEEKLTAIRSRINAGPTLQARLNLPDHQNFVEKIKEKQEEIREKQEEFIKEIESKHQELETKLKMAHLKFPNLKEIKLNKEEKILGSRNLSPYNTDTYVNKHLIPNKKQKMTKHHYHHQSKHTSASITSEKPVIILDHRNGESKIKSTAHAGVIETSNNPETSTSKFEGALERLREKRLDTNLKLKEKPAVTPKENMDESRNTAD